MSSFYRLSLRSSWSLLLLFFVASSVYGQDTTNISITGRNMPISGFIRQLESKTGFSFIYGKAAFDDQERVSLTLSNVGLSEALSALFKGKNLSWQYREKTVILSRQAPQNSQVTSDSAPQYSVTGTVVDPQGNPIEGASVALRGQSRGQGTNSKGEFSFSGIPENAVLVVSSIGYAAKQLRLSGQREVRVSLDTLVHEIEGVEVVSTGYQDIPKERATGSFVGLDNKLLNRAVSTNILDRLAWVTSGLNFQKNTSNTGNKSEITIRGLSTIQANPNPLIVIDGFPYTESPTDQSFINNVNPNDVESITVLKDAAASSIWGARAGNGVIVITTKRGKYNQPIKIGINTTLNITEKPNLSYIPTISSTDMVQFEKMYFSTGAFNEYDASYPAFNYFPVTSQAVEILLAQKRGDLSDRETESLLLNLQKKKVQDDIKKYFLQKIVNQQYALNFSSGTDKYNHYGSIGYDNNRLQDIGNRFNRLTIRYDNTYRPIKNIEIINFLSYVQSSEFNNGLSYHSLLPSGNGIAPYASLVDENGTPLSIPDPQGLRTAFIDTASFPALQDWAYRPLENQQLNNNSSKLYDTRLGASIRYTIFSGISMEIKYQYQKIIANVNNEYSKDHYFVRNLVNRFQYINPAGIVAYPVPLGAILDESSSTQTSWNTRIQINTNKTWGQNSITAIGGMETRELNFALKMNRLYGYDPETGKMATNIDYSGLYNYRPDGYTTKIPNPNTIGGKISRYLSYYLNGAYNLSDKYTLSFSGRVDGSNFFGIKANQRITPLLSSGISWNISKEKFYRVPAFPSLKIRATYGYSGNTYNSVTAYPTLAYLPGSINYLINTEFADVKSPGNPELRWEKVRMTNIGIDFATDENVFSGSLEYYTKKGIDLIGAVELDPTSGFSNYVGNRASTKGHGIDLVLNTKNLRGKIHWNSILLLSFYKDQVVNYQGVSTAAQYYGGYPVIGKPMYSIFSYNWAGLDPANGDPRAYISDTIDSYSAVYANAKPEDMVYSGPSSPLIFGSLRNEISISNFTLSLNIVYKLKYFFRRNSINYQRLIKGWGGHSDYSLRWTKSGDELMTYVPSISYTQSASRDNVYAYSSVLVEKGDHIRLQDIRLSFDLKQEKIKNLPTRNAQLFLYINNVGIIWKANKHNIDPDYGNNIIPPSRSLAIGLNANF